MGTHQGLAGAEVEQHVVDDGHVRLGLKAHDVGSLLRQDSAAGHVHVVAWGERHSEGWRATRASVREVCSAKRGAGDSGAGGVLRARRRDQNTVLRRAHQ